VYFNGRYRPSTDFCFVWTDRNGRYRPISGYYEPNRPSILTVILRRCNRTDSQYRPCCPVGGTEPTIDIDRDQPTGRLKPTDRTDNTCANFQVTAMKNQIVGLFWGWRNLRLSGRWINFCKKVHGKIAVIVEQSWNPWPMTAKSANRVARTSPRHLSRPAWAGFFWAGYQKINFAFALFSLRFV